MKFLISILSLLSFIPFTTANAAQPVKLNSTVTFTPKIPADCYDGFMHKKLHAVTNIGTTETDRDVVVNFRTYVLDCGYNQAREMTATFFGPLHEGRCDLSILPYDGVRVMSFTEPLGPQPPYDKINICNVTLNFDKRNLQAKGVSNYDYKYRFGGLLEYTWRIAVAWDSVTGSFSTTMSQEDQQTTPPPIHHNLDRTPSHPIYECNAETYEIYKRQGARHWTVESPVAKVNGGTLNISFYVTGVSCVKDADPLLGRPFAWGRDNLPMAKAVVIRNSAHSTANYDWNIYRALIENPYKVGNLVTFDVPLAEVMEDSQMALFKRGEVAQVRFKVYVSGSNVDNGRSGYYDLILNLDPNAP